jgi:LuxR family maltose regulon positive regulatory protein
MQKTDRLIRTKLRLPFIRPGLVSRPKLQEQIAQGMRGPLTLVIAPAGFGKTTLVASCIISCAMPAAWLSLDQHDNQGGSFLSYLVAALHEADSAIGGEAVQFLKDPGPTPTEAILISLINDLDTSSRETALVLDDYQFIHSQAVHEAVAFLLEHSPTTFHLVIATRSDPALPLARLRARGQIVELRLADLRFTEIEAAQFLNEVMGLHLSSRSIEALEDRTEGWIAGLQMAALSMRGRNDVDGFIQAFQGTNRYILDFLVEEVLARETVDVQTFLLQTSVLNRLSGSICDALTGSSDGHLMLEKLEKSNLFLLPLDDTCCWYRYHHLFADLLQNRLHQTEPGQIPQLLLRAADWCDRNGQMNEAVRYALSSNDYDKAAALIEKYWGVLANEGEIETVWSWLAALPKDMVKNSAPLGIATCWMLWLDGKISSIEPHLVDAETAFTRSKDADQLNKREDAWLLVLIATLHSILARHKSDFTAARTYAEQAIPLIPDYLPLQLQAQLRTMALLSLASAYNGMGELEKAIEAYRETILLCRLGKNATGLAGMTYWMFILLLIMGRLNEAETACREALRFMEEQGMGRLSAAGLLHVVLAEVLLERNELEAAEAQLTIGRGQGKRSGRLDAIRNAAPAQVRLHLARGDARGALAAVDEAESAQGEPDSPLSRSTMLSLRSRIVARQGLLGEAVRCAEEAVHMMSQDHSSYRAVADQAAFRAHAANSQPGEAVTLLAQAIASVEQKGQLGMAIELRLLRSLEYEKLGLTREAEADLEWALGLAEQEGYVRVFLDEGQPMQLLIAQWLAHAVPGPLRDYAARLLSLSDTALQIQKAHASDRLIEPLSQRELEVLHLLALGRTNQEIARQLFVAPGTIKAHTASIYRKLDVGNRTEAVNCARQLSIIP